MDGIIHCNVSMKMRQFCHFYFSALLAFVWVKVKFLSNINNTIVSAIAQYSYILMTMFIALFIQSQMGYLFLAISTCHATRNGFIHDKSDLIRA